VRPVNLIPPEDRRGDLAPLRAGKLSYVLVAGLALAVAGVTILVLTGNQVEERKTELASLEAEEAAATARAQAVAPYAEFAALSQARVSTVTSLAQSRFDWERVLRELALVLPDDVWLTSLAASAGGGAGTEGAAAESIAGPSLLVKGCGAGHPSVARLLAALRDIDGVTRVGLTKSALPEKDASDLVQASSGTASGAGSGECQTRDFIAGFEATVAFDGATVPPASATPPAPIPPADEAQPAETAQAQESVAEQTGEAREAANVIPGVSR
jgi:Tfp pilus assembly protein PilN